MLGLIDRRSDIESLSMGRENVSRIAVPAGTSVCPSGGKTAKRRGMFHQYIIPNTAITMKVNRITNHESFMINAIITGRISEVPIHSFRGR
jgi:hypothetical protein